ncbi:hypothetical protein [Jeotgalibacillus soli]|uniref:Inner spore coat protein n=1 Tax=Jeotgalibacillus soli TaxID=889306 RepID=A0A0C2W5E3_9BACL|nr:hypothetical protein [Jeotgalibacillus soli]KIL51806.1 hypothetical protein KP78_01760 [Jeotgalibacillus soli]
MYYQNPYYQFPINRQQYPPVDVTTFEHSVKAFQVTVVEAGTLLKKFAEPQFAHRIMSAAQTGNHKEVDSLIKSIGISTPVTAKYTPDGIFLTIHAEAQGSQCCTLTMYLRWGKF